MAKDKEFTKEELENWEAEGRQLGRPLYTKETWSKFQKLAGTEGIDYSNINIAAQAERLLRRFSIEDAAQVARGTAYAAKWNGDKHAEKDWLEVEREILQRPRPSSRKRGH